MKEQELENRREEDRSANALDAKITICIYRKEIKMFMH